MPLGFLAVLLGMAAVKTVPAALKLAGDFLASGLVAKELRHETAYVAVDVVVPREAVGAELTDQELRLGVERAQVLKRRGNL